MPNCQATKTIHVLMNRHLNFPFQTEMENDPFQTIVSRLIQKAMF